MCTCRQRRLARFALGADFDLTPDVVVDVAPELAPAPAVALADDSDVALAPDPEVALAPELEEALVPAPAVALASDPDVADGPATAAEVRPALAHAASSSAHSALRRLLALAAPSSRRRMIAHERRASRLANGRARDDWEDFWAPWTYATARTVGGRPMAGHQVLVLRIGVRIPAPQLRACAEAPLSGRRSCAHRAGSLRGCVRRHTSASRGNSISSV